MNIFFILAIFIANVIAIALVYQFVKKLEKTDVIIFIAASVAFLYIGVSIIYWISGFGIDSKINEAAKNFIVTLFVPINVIILIPFVAGKYAKYKLGKISKRDFAERLIKVIVVAIIILTIECVYFKRMKSNIKILNTLIEKTTEEDNNTTNITNTEANQITTNIIENTNQMTDINVNTNTNKINSNQLIY